MRHRILLFSLAVLIVFGVAFGGGYLGGWVVARPTPSPTPRSVVVPDVLGMTAYNAVRTLEDRFLQVTDAQENTTKSPKGTVIRMSPAAGSVVKSETVVAITISAGPRK